MMNESELKEKIQGMSNKDLADEIRKTQSNVTMKLMVEEIVARFVKSNSK